MITVDEEVADLDEVRMFGQLFDRVAAILQNSGVAVDIGEGRGRRSGIAEPRVVGHRAGLLEQRADAVSVVAS